MNRGFVFSLDAMLALFCTFFLVLLCFSQFTQVDFSRHETRYTLSLLSDSGLTSLEKSGLLEQAIANRNPSLFSSFVNTFPAFVCAQLGVRDADNAWVLLSTKSSCLGEQGIIVTTNRLVPVWESGQYRFYTVTLRVWEALS